jgi:hypothetical protein
VYNLLETDREHGNSRQAASRPDAGRRPARESDYPAIRRRRFVTIIYILIAFVVLVVGLVVVVAMQPSEFKIMRSLAMAAPRSLVFEQVNDFHKWEEWSPWAKLDPNMKQTYEGSPSGTGAMYSWAGSGKVGEGKMTITEAQPFDFIKIQLAFLKPFKATNMSEFTFHQEGDQTQVTWSMTGRNGFIAKAFCLLVNMDKLIGRDFDKGLASMKSIVESNRPLSP